MLVLNPLAKLRIQAGFKTALEAATRLEVSRVHLLNVEQGRAKPSDKLRDKLAQLYQQDPQTIHNAYHQARQRILQNELGSA